MQVRDSERRGGAERRRGKPVPPGTRVIVQWSQGRRQQALEGPAEALGPQMVLLTLRTKQSIPSKLRLVNPATGTFAFAEATWFARQTRDRSVRVAVALSTSCKSFFGS